MKLLDGAELAGYIKERQARQVRALGQAKKILPKLIIIQTKDDPVINTYVKLKKRYGKDIGVEVADLSLKQDEVQATIEASNSDKTIHGIIIQLPLADVLQTDKLTSLVSPSKDVDGLGTNPRYASATAMAIEWLLAGYNVSLENKKIMIIGHGRLVGQPLYRLWQTAGHDVTVLDTGTEDLGHELSRADIIVTATGVAGLITSKIIPVNCIVVDAGVASESGKTVGDVADDAYERHDLTITPRIGGVGPLTVAALFDNVIQATSA